jgi:hypothetical protein
LEQYPGSYLVVGLCNRNLTPRYRQLVSDATSTKQVHHLRSPDEMRGFLQVMKQEYWLAVMDGAQSSGAADASQATHR